MSSMSASNRKPLRISGFSFADGGGGAAKAAYRLHSELRDQGQNAILNVLRKTSDDESVIDISKYAKLGTLASEISPRIDQLPIKLLHSSSSSFLSTGWQGAVKPISLPSVENADILMLYWVARGFISIRQIGKLLSTGKPVIWRLSDMWPFTGGCHYSQGCDRHQNSCGKCPQLSSQRDFDLSSWLHSSKLRYWDKANLVVVSPSNWMAKEAKLSSLFSQRQIRVIPTGVDCKLFRPVSKLIARAALQLPKDGQFVLFGASSVSKDTRKGGDFFIQAFIKAFGTRKDPPNLVVFGTTHRPPGIPDHMPVHCLGTIHDEAMLPLAYSACDFFVAPSREENLANTVLEAMACGRPIIATDVGGMPDAIENDENGLLVSPNDVDCMANAMVKLAQDQAQQKRMSLRSRELALERFSLVQQARSYIELSRELLS